MSIYSPSLTTNVFHTEAAIATLTANDVMNQFQTILFAFGMASLAVFITTFVTRELARRKYIHRWKYLYTRDYFSLSVVIVVGIFVLALTGLSIQTNSYTSEITGAKQLRTTVRNGVIDVDNTIAAIAIHCNISRYIKHNLTKVLKYINDQVTSMQGSVETYANDAIEAVNTMQMSAAFVVLIILFATAAACILYISAYLDTLAGWHYTVGIHILVFVFFWISALLLLVITLQANTCMDPATSVANLWPITDPLLAYYVNCSVDTTLRNPIADALNVADDICGGIISAFDTDNATIKIRPHGCLGVIATGCTRVVERMQCTEMSKGIRRLVDALCIESVIAISFTFIASTLMLVALLWTTFTLSINVHK